MDKALLCSFLKLQLTANHPNTFNEQNDYLLSLLQTIAQSQNSEIEKDAVNGNHKVKGTSFSRAVLLALIKGNNINDVNSIILSKYIFQIDESERILTFTELQDNLIEQGFEHLFLTFDKGYIRSLKNSLHRKGIKAGSQWKTIIESVKLKKQKGIFFYGEENGEKWLNQIVQNNLEPVPFSFRNTIEAFLKESEINIEDFKEEYDRLSQFCNDKIIEAENKFKEAKQSNNFFDIDSAEKSQKHYETELNNLLVGEFSKSFIGKKIKTLCDSYILEDIIHKGNFSVLYKATKDGKLTDTLNQTVAIKVLRVGRRGYGGRQIFRGAEIQKSVAEDYTGKAGSIIKVIDGPFEAQGFTFFIMEYIEGKPFSRWLEDKKHTIESEDKNYLNELKKYLQQVRSLIIYLHENRIYHLDLSTSNFILSQGEVYLTDFDNVQQGKNHFNVSKDYTEFAEQAFMYENLNNLKELDEKTAMAADIYSFNRIVINGFLIGIKQDKGWEGNYHNNQNMIQGPRVEKYQKTLKDLLLKGTEFCKDVDFKTHSEELLENFSYKKIPWYKRIPRELIALPSLALTIIAVLLLIFQLTKQSDRYREFGLFTSATNEKELKEIKAFKRLFTLSPFKDSINLIKNRLLQDDTIINHLIEIDTVLNHICDSDTVNCLKFSPKDKEYRYAIHQAFLSPTISDRDSINPTWIEMGNQKFNKFLHGIKQVKSEHEFLPAHLSDIIGFNSDGIIQPILVYAVYENKNDSILIRYPYYEGKSFKNYNYPDRKDWYKKGKYSEPETKNKFIPLEYLSRDKNWTAVISQPYSDYKEGFLPVRTIIFEHRNDKERYLLMIDFMGKVN